MSSKNVRLVAVKKQETKTSPTEEIGAPGLKEFGGFLQEEFVVDLRGQRGAQRYREMVDNCPAVDAALTTMRNSCRRAIADGRVEPFSQKGEDVERAEFVQECFDDMSHSRSDMDTEALTMFEYGYAPMNIVYKRRNGFNRDEEVSSRFSDGAVGWKKVSLRAQESVLRWQFSELGQRTLAMVQIPAPSYQEFVIPMDRLALFRTTSIKNNPEGRSLLRAAWFAYHFFKRGTTIGWVGAERDVTGIPVLKGPAELFSPEPTAAQANGLARLKQIGENVRNDEQSCVLLPSDVDPETKVPMYEFGLVSSPGSKVTDVSGMTRDQERQILMVLFSDFLLMGHEKIGTQALFVGRVGLYSMQLDALLGRYDETINRQMIPRLAMLNGWPMDRMPRYVHGSVSEKSLDELAKFLTAYTGSGGVLDPGLDEYVREMAGWPAPQAEGLEVETDEEGDALAVEADGEEGAEGQEEVEDGEAEKQTPPKVAKGDLPGHEFHGNQYTEAVGSMSAREINRELDRVEEERSKIADEMIAAGRGHEKNSETERKTDPLSMRLRHNNSRHYTLRQEIRDRYGSDIRRLPTRGFGPRVAKRYDTRQRRGKFAPSSGDVVSALTLLRDRQRVGGGDSISHGMDVATEYPFSSSRDYRDEVEGAPVEDVELRGVKATQPHVRRDRVRDFLENPGVVPPGKRNLSGVLEDAPVVFETEDGRFLQDGHHRVAAAKLLGRKSVRARVIRGHVEKAGDLPGHEFRGNQYTGGGGSIEERSATGAEFQSLTHFTKPENVEGIKRDGILPSKDGTYGNGIYLSTDPQTAPPGTTYATSRMRTELSPSAKILRVKNAVDFDRVLDELKVQHNERDIAGFLRGKGIQGIHVTQRNYLVVYDPSVIRVTGVEKAGDLPGHEFRGNQWTGGGGSATPQEQTDTLLRYTEETNSEINSGLRSGSIPSGHERDVEVMDQLTKMHAVPAKVYRVVPSEIAAKLKVGSTLTDRGFVSTTKSLDYAKEYNEGVIGDGSILHISVPKGTRGADVMKIPGMKDSLYSQNEREVILPRGSEFFVHDIVNGEIHVRLRKKS